MAVVNEHPSVDVRKLYAGRSPPRSACRSTTSCGSPERAVAAVVRVAPTRQIGFSENAEFVAVSLLRAALERHRRLADRGLFADDVDRVPSWRSPTPAATCTVALAEADPDAREVLERAAVADLDAEPFVEACNLIAAARPARARPRSARPRSIPTRCARPPMPAAQLESLDDSRSTAQDAAGVLLGWLRATQGGA